jgi:hypothetical protein
MRKGTIWGTVYDSMKQSYAHVQLAFYKCMLVSLIQCIGTNTERIALQYITTVHTCYKLHTTNNESQMVPFLIAGRITYQ